MGGGINLPLISHVKGIAMNPSSLKFPFSLKLPSRRLRLWRAGRLTGRWTGKIALLFTILCAGQLYGMELKRGNLGAFEQLPEDVHKVIIKALATSNDLEQTIEAIKVASALQGVRYDNLKDFTKLVHILADKFYRPTIFHGLMGPAKSTERVAEMFVTPVAKEYIELNRELLKMTAWIGSRNPDRTEVINKLKELIEAGADVNFSPAYTLNVEVGKVVVQVSTSPMRNAMLGGNLDTLQLLLDYGAKLESDEYYDTYDFWPHYDGYWMLTTKEQVKQLIDKERVKRLQLR